MFLGHTHLWLEWREIYRDTHINGEHLKMAKEAGLPLSAIRGQLVVRQERTCARCGELQLREVST